MWVLLQNWLPSKEDKRKLKMFCFMCSPKLHIFTHTRCNLYNRMFANCFWGNEYTEISKRKTWTGFLSLKFNNEITHNVMRCLTKIQGISFTLNTENCFERFSRGHVFLFIKTGRVFLHIIYNSSNSTVEKCVSKTLRLFLKKNVHFEYFGLF